MGVHKSRPIFKNRTSPLCNLSKKIKRRTLLGTIWEQRSNVQRKNVMLNCILKLGISIGWNVDGTLTSFHLKDTRVLGFGNEKKARRSEILVMTRTFDATQWWHKVTLFLDSETLLNVSNLCSTVLWSVLFLIENEFLNVKGKMNHITKRGFSLHNLGIG